MLAASADGFQQASRVKDDVVSMGNDIALNFDDDQVRGDLLDILIQLVVEQPLKIPALSSVVLYVNDKTPEAVEEIIVRAGRKAQAAVIAGNWRDFKLVLRFFALLQGILKGDGVLPIFDELFDRVVDLQSKSSTDVSFAIPGLASSPLTYKQTLGPEFVKIILLTIPYLMVSNAHDLNAKVKDLLNKTMIVANEKQPFQDLVETYTGGSERMQSRSSLFLLQAQLQAQAEQGWPLRFMPQLYQSQGMANGDGDEASSKKHSLPAVTFPEHINPGPKALFPEAFLSIYANQDIAVSVFGLLSLRLMPGMLTHKQTVAPTSDLACSLIRDTLVDTINVLHFNRNAVAKFLVEMDCYWAPGTFAKRGTPVDKLIDLDDSQSVWKPEDMTLDALFSQIFSLPTPEHKLVYYHSVTTELCRLSPSTIAPCLGRAMRFLFRSIADMDIELAYRFMDWFAQHLSNFEFRWKWDEWRENLDESNLQPKKAFIIGAIDKEIRLSFVKRVRDTLPQPYHELITDGKEKDTPDFKYKFESKFPHPNLCFCPRMLTNIT
jgi:nuclear cap-binding protein subunit 1